MYICIHTGRYSLPQNTPRTLYGLSAHIFEFVCIHLKLSRINRKRACLLSEKYSINDNIVLTSPGAPMPLPSQDQTHSKWYEIDYIALTLKKWVRPLADRSPPACWRYFSVDSNPSHCTMPRCRRMTTVSATLNTTKMPSTRIQSVSGVCVWVRGGERGKEEGGEGKEE